MHKLIFPILSILFLSSCGSDVQTTQPTSSLKDGFLALETHCFSCHGAFDNIEDRTAPPMDIVKQVYAKNYDNETQFTRGIITFLENPTRDNALLKNSLEKYGAMQKVLLTDKEMQDITYYLYHTTIEKEGWFEQTYPNERLTYLGEVERLSPIEKRLEYALQTKKILGANLMNAIKTQGVENAVTFCSNQAIHLTDSVALANNIGITRVSDKHRSPQNMPNEQELAYLHTLKEQLKNNEPLQPYLVETEKQTVGYYPIILEAKCMKCHGQPHEDIAPPTLSAIQLAYPNDQAIGYQEGDVRGIWVVEMPKQ